MGGPPQTHTLTNKRSDLISRSLHSKGATKNERQNQTMIQEVLSTAMMMFNRTKRTVQPLQWSYKNSNNAVDKNYSVSQEMLAQKQENLRTVIDT